MCPYETLKRVQQILQDVRAQIALAVRVWKRFESNDLAYFGDLQYMDDLGVLYNLNQTRELFEDIEGLVLRLVLLEQSCENHTDIVSQYNILTETA